MNNSIRYFDRWIDPGAYRRGFGFWGWWAHTSNRVRAWLEQKTVLAVLRVECRLAGLTPREIKNVVRQVKEHEDFIPILKETRLPPFVQRLMREKDPVELSTIEERSYERYKDGRVNDQVQPIEMGLAKTFSAFQQKRDRGSRYYAGRKTFNDVGETEIVPVPRRTRRLVMVQQDDNQPEPGAPMPPQSPLAPETKKQVRQADFELGKNTPHLRLPNGLPKPPRV